jgi:hypothetical protein
VETGGPHTEGMDPGTPPSNVVRFPGDWLGPRDWFGPRDELVPLAHPSHDPATDDSATPAVEPATPAAGFWEGSVIQDAMAAPAADGAGRRLRDARPRLRAAQARRFARVPARPYRRLSLIAAAVFVVGALALIAAGSTRPARNHLSTTAANLAPPLLAVAHPSGGTRRTEGVRSHRVRAASAKLAAHHRLSAPQQQAPAATPPQAVAVAPQPATSTQAAASQPPASAYTPASHTPAAASDSTVSSGGGDQTGSAPAAAPASQSTAGQSPASESTASQSTAPAGPTGSGAVLGPGHCSC